MHPSHPSKDATVMHTKLVYFKRQNLIAIDPWDPLTVQGVVFVSIWLRIASWFDWKTKWYFFDIPFSFELHISVMKPVELRSEAKRYGNNKKPRARQNISKGLEELGPSSDTLRRNQPSHCAILMKLGVWYWVDHRLMHMLWICSYLASKITSQKTSSHWIWAKSEQFWQFGPRSKFLDIVKNALSLF